MPNVLMLVLAWVGGILTQHWTNAGYGVIGIALLVHQLLFTRHTRVLWLIVVCALGICRMGWYQWMPIPPPVDLDRVEVTISDVKSNWQEQRVVMRDSNGYGYVANVPPQETFFRGMHVFVDGRVTPYEYGNSPYEDSMLQRHIIGEVQLADGLVVGTESDWQLPFDRIRLATQRRLTQTFREPIASVVVGMLLGIGGDVSPSVAEAFRISGTSHILVISGWNITIVAALCQGVVRSCRLRGVWPLIIPLAIICMYVVFTGASAAVVRAGFMGAVIVIGKWLNRPRDMWNIIGIEIFAMCLIDPTTLWDLGFQLSTCATIGLIGFGTLIEEKLALTPFGSKDLAWAREVLATTLAAQIPTLPIMLCRLGTPSPWSLLANMIITPVVPYAMASGTIVALLTWVSVEFASWCAWIAIPAYAWIIDGSIAIAALPAPGQWKLEHEWLEWSLHAGWVAWLVGRGRSETPNRTLEMV